MTTLMSFEERAYKEILVKAFPDRFPLKLVVDHKRFDAKKQLKKQQKEQLKNWRNKW